MSKVIDIYDLFGIVGVLLVLGAYLLTQTRSIKNVSYTYNAMNGLGAILIIVSLFSDFNLSSFLLQIAWLLISLFGLCRMLAEDPKARRLYRRVVGREDLTVSSTEIDKKP